MTSLANRIKPAPSLEPFPQDMEETKQIDSLVEDAGIAAVPTTREIDYAGAKSELDRLTPWQALRVYKRVTAFGMLAAFSAMMDGYQINLNGSIVSFAGFIHQMSGPNVKVLDGKWVSAWGGIQSAGQVIGAFSLHHVTEKYGRKIGLYTLWLMLVISVLIESVTTRWWHWLLAKLFAGIGVGMLQSTLPLYITEIAPNQLRGLLVNAYTLWFAVGQLLAPVILKEMKSKNPQDWKTPVYTQWAFLGAMIIILVCVPESPWWAVTKGKTELARKILNRLYKGVQGYDVDRQLEVLQRTIAINRERDASVDIKPLDMFKGETGKRFLISCYPKVLQQFVGLAVFNTYATYFFQLAGNKDPFLVTVILSCVQLIALLFIMSVSDAIGRRPFTVYGYSVTVVSVLCLGIIGCFNYQSPSLGSLLIFFACLAIFSTTFASACGYAYLTEVAEQKYRARTSGYGLAAQSCAGTMFSFVVPIMLNGPPKWGIKTGFFFAGTGLPGVIGAWFLLPETARRSPAEIDELFRKKVNLRKWRGYKTEVEMALEEKKFESSDQRVV